MRVHPPHAMLCETHHEVSTPRKKQKLVNNTALLHPSPFHELTLLGHIQERFIADAYACRC